MSCTLSVHTIMSETEAVDPTDYEEFVSQQRDPQHMVKFWTFLRMLTGWL